MAESPTDDILIFPGDQLTSTPTISEIMSRIINGSRHVNRLTLSDTAICFGIREGLVPSRQIRVEHRPSNNRIEIIPNIISVETSRSLQISTWVGLAPVNIFINSKGEKTHLFHLPHGSRRSVFQSVITQALDALSSGPEKISTIDLGDIPEAF